MLGHESNGMDESAANGHNIAVSNGEIPALDDASDDEDVLVNMSSP
jgi:hypothetical protein